MAYTKRVSKNAKLQEQYQSLPDKLSALEGAVDFFACMYRGDETLAKENVHEKVLKLANSPARIVWGDDTQAVENIITLARICTKSKILDIAELKLNAILGDFMAI